MWLAKSISSKMDPYSTQVFAPETFNTSDKMLYKFNILTFNFSH